MKKYLKEIIILLIQLFMFYIYPLLAVNPIGMVMIIILATLLLSVIIASISKEKVKYLYSIVIAILFIPSVFIYYNKSALIYSIWYLVISTFGLLVGTIIYKLTNKKNFRKGSELWI